MKFQKRDVDLAIPEEQKGVLKETPWGTYTYLEYRRFLEFGEDEFDHMQRVCDSIKMPIFSSVWDIPSAEFMLKYDMPYVKLPSAKITDLDLLRWVAAHYSCPSIISTGMSTMEEIHAAIRILPDAIILHCN